jgi:O-antigen/teichoic acid export membrane protein
VAAPQLSAGEVAAPAQDAIRSSRSSGGTRRDTLVNLLGRGWTALMAFAFVPVYIRLLGVEAYGLVGLAVTLQAVFALLDMGIATTLNRELARRGARAGAAEDAREARDLVRTLEALYWCAAAVIALVVAALAPAIATRWLHPHALSADTVVRALRLLGLMIALQFPFTLYESGLLGLRRQVTLNVILGSGATLRFGAVLGVLHWVSPTVEAFFAWQALVAVLQTTVAGVALWRRLPASPARPRFDRARLADSWRFAAGMAAISFTAVVLTQMDKVVLSKLLSLEAFGHYTLAATVAGALYILFLPLFQAVFPRLSHLVAADDTEGVRALYRRSAQWVAVLVLPAAVVLVLFGHDVMLLWTRDPAVADATWLVLALLAAGTALNGLMNIPYALQLAYGWTAFAFYQNVVAIVTLVPAVVLASRRFGPAGAAAVWLLLNFGYVTVGITVMHRRLLRGEQRHWYDDTVVPLLAATAAAGLARLAFPSGATTAAPVLLATVLGALLLTYTAATLATPAGRELISTLGLAWRRVA